MFAAPPILRQTLLQVSAFFLIPSCWKTCLHSVASGWVNPLYFILWQRHSNPLRSFSCGQFERAEQEPSVAWTGSWYIKGKIHFAVDFPKCDSDSAVSPNPQEWKRSFLYFYFIYFICYGSQPLVMSQGAFMPLILATSPCVRFFVVVPFQAHGEWNQESLLAGS